MQYGTNRNSFKIDENQEARDQHKFALEPDISEEP